MTLDEAIKICEEDAEKIGGNPQSDCHAERCRQITEWLRELRKAKRLLGEALRVLNDGSCNKDCRQCKWNENGCEMSCRFAWKYGDEVSALIGETNDEP